MFDPVAEIGKTLAMSQFVDAVPGEEPMAIKVFIRRKYPKNKLKELYRHIREIRSLVPLQPGYISSEYLKTIDDSDELTTISSWFSLEDWQAWLATDQRKKIQAKIDALEGVTSEYRIYRHIKTR